MYMLKCKHLKVYVGHDCKLSVHWFLHCEMGTTQVQVFQLNFDFYVIRSAKHDNIGVVPGRT